jgi:hypothetical protein
MRGAIPPLPQYAFMAWRLVKHRDNFAFFVNIHYTENVSNKSYESDVLYLGK